MLNKVLPFLLLPFLLCADEEPKPGDYDYDLYRKDEEAIFTNLEYLFWTVEEGSLDYALKMSKPAPSGISYASGDVKIADFGWNPGLRVNLGYFNAKKYYEFFLQYTWLRTTGHDTDISPDAPNLYLNGTWPHIFTSPLLSAKSRISNNYNILDLLVDRVFIPNPHLRMRIYSGFTAAFIGQNWYLKYRSQKDETNIFNRWRFRAGGFKLMTGFDWFWRKDFYITAKTSFASLIGRYKNRAYQESNPYPVRPVRDFIFKDIRLAYNVMFLLGPSYQKNLCNSRIEVFAGYELSTWFNLHEIYRSSANASGRSKETWLNRGVFSLHGLTTRLTCDF